MEISLRDDIIDMFKFMSVIQTSKTDTVGQN